MTLYKLTPLYCYCRHNMASEGVQKAHDAAFKALNEAYQGLMDGERHLFTTFCNVLDAWAKYLC